MGKKNNTTNNTKAPAPAKRAAQPAAAKPPVVRQAAAAPARAIKPGAAVTKRAAKTARFTADDVALRAYFIAEKRNHLGLPGNAHGDWLEAERQLQAESQNGKKPAKAKAS